MPDMEFIPFIRYLEAKKFIDDRSLNARVWDSLAENLSQPTKPHPLKVIEAGAGIGTMLERMLETQLLQDADYTGLDIDLNNIAYAYNRLPVWSGECGFKIEQLAEGIHLLEKGSQRVEAGFKHGDILTYATMPENRSAYDLLVANAFLDLTDIPTALPRLFSLLKREGLFYFSINFDGVTILEPVIDPKFDQLVLDLYHHTMDERITNNLPSGDSQSGRHLFAYIRQAGGQILAAGASDWVVFPGVNGYPDRDADFLHFIIHTIHASLQSNTLLNQKDLEQWIHTRHAQVRRAELVYIAHQIDILGKMRYQLR